MSDHPVVAYRPGDPSDPSDPDAVDPDAIGMVLARLRHERRVTGVVLAQRVGLSQSTISKIENGQRPPSPTDVERIATALDAPPDLVADLVNRASELRNRPGRYGRKKRERSRSDDPGARVSLRQRDILEDEKKAREVRNFEPIVVPGLLQISEYARRVVNGYHSVFIDGGESTRFQTTAEVVTTRMHRQELLYNEGKSFEFLIMESVLGNRYAPPEYMLAQVNRLAAAAELPNVTIRIIPTTVELPFAVVGGFVLYDDDLVIIETVSASSHRDSDQIDLYRRIFDQYVLLSTTDLKPVLSRYRTMYAKDAIRAERAELR